jgi:hypothetical protein
LNLLLFCKVQKEAAAVNRAVANQTREFRTLEMIKINNQSLDSLVLQAVMRFDVERKLMVGVRDRKDRDG